MDLVAKKDIKLKVLTNNKAGQEISILDIFHELDNGEFNFISTDKPDYIVYAQSGNSSYLDYNCVRISIDAEHYTPDFNVCDYAISDDIMEFGDRHCRMPYLAYITMRKEIEAAQRINNIQIIENELKQKLYFCNFIYSNDIGDKMRRTLFDLLSSYRPVQSGGRLLNNLGYYIPGGIDDYEEKIKFQSKCKFTLAIENAKAPGYTTEKILHAFIARTIPIYWGNPLVDEYFNKEAFIDCNDYKNLDDLLEKVKEVDQDDELYLQMINAPFFNKNFNPEFHNHKAAEFLGNIFRQEPEDAKRRTSVLHSRLHEVDFRKGRRRRERKQTIQFFFAHLLKKIGISEKVILFLKKHLIYK